jgi:hypothetical protein
MTQKRVNECWRIKLKALTELWIHKNITKKTTPKHNKQDEHWLPALLSRPSFSVSRQHYTHALQLIWNERKERKMRLVLEKKHNQGEINSTTTKQPTRETSHIITYSLKIFPLMCFLIMRFNLILDKVHSRQSTRARLILRVSEHSTQQ